MENKILRSKLNGLRISPRKVSLVTKAISNFKVSDAKRALMFSDKKGAFYILKLLNSAVSNAKNLGIKEEDLTINSILVGPGQTLKRGRFVSRGSHHKIMKRTSKITLNLRAVNEKKETKNGK